MLAAARARLTYANVIASIALFVALGGTGYAAIKIPKNSVGSKQLKKNAVTAAKVKNGTLSLGDFKKGQVLTPGSAEARFLEESAASRFLPASAAGQFLPKTGKAADADKLDNLDSSAFLQGQRISRVFLGFANPGGDTESDQAIPGIGNIEFGCHGASFNVTFEDGTGGATVWQRRDQSGGNTEPTQEVVASGGTLGIGNPGSSNTPNDEAGELSDVHILKNGKTAALQIFTRHQRNPTGSPSHATCSASLTGVIG
jgi:hypothetical protein